MVGSGKCNSLIKGLYHHCGGHGGHCRHAWQCQCKAHRNQCAFVEGEGYLAIGRAQGVDANGKGSGKGCEGIPTGGDIGGGHAVEFIGGYVVAGEERAVGAAEDA